MNSIMVRLTSRRRQADTQSTHDANRIGQQPIVTTRAPQMARHRERQHPVADDARHRVRRQQGDLLTQAYPRPWLCRNVGAMEVPTPKLKLRPME